MLMEGIDINKRKIFCIGLGKSGTTSFGSLMQCYGFRNKSFFSLPGILSSQLGLWDLVWAYIEDGDTFDDYPWPLIYETVYERYPDALYVLTTRKDGNQWAQSVIRFLQQSGYIDELEQLVLPADARTNPASLVDYYNEHIHAARKFFAKNSNYIEVCWEDKESVARFKTFVVSKGMVSSEVVARTDIPHEKNSMTYDPHSIFELLWSGGFRGSSLKFAEAQNPDVSAELVDRARQYVTRQQTGFVSKKKDYVVNGVRCKNMLTALFQVVILCFKRHGSN